MSDLLRSIVAEAAAIAADAKKAAGHQDHDGFSTADGMTRIYCGCGALLLDLPAQDLAEARRALSLLATKLTGRDTRSFPGGNVVEVTFRLALTSEENAALTKAIRAAADQEQR